MNSYTAHATHKGIVVIQYAGEKIRGMAFLYGEKPVEITDRQLLDDLLEAAEDELMENEIIEDDRLVSSAELGNDGVSHNIGDDDRRFVPELLSWQAADGELVGALLLGELSGVREVKTTPEPILLSEPLTNGEALWLIDRVLGKQAAEGVSPQLAERSSQSYLMPLLRETLEHLENYLQIADNYNWRQGRFIKQEDGRWLSNSEARRVPRWLAYHKFLPKEYEQRTEQERDAAWEELLLRLRSTINRNDLGGSWSYEGMYFIGERAGVTDITKELAVKERSPQQQYIDCDIPDLEKQARQTSLFNQLYDENGKNRSFAEQNLYYWRMAHTRDLRFRKLMRYISKAPLAVLRKHIIGPNATLVQWYKQSVRQCSPGPISKMVDGKWVNLAAEGQQAIDLLVSKGFRREQLAEDVRYFVADKWHRLWLRKDQLEELQRVAERRIAEAESRLGPVQTLGQKLPAQQLPPVPQVVLQMLNPKLKQQELMVQAALPEDEE